MESMDISASFKAANQSAFVELEGEGNTVISDTEAGIITTRHLSQLKKLRCIKYKAEQLAQLAFNSYGEYEEDWNEVARPMQKVHYIGTDRVPTLASWTEMSRLRQLYEEDPLAPETKYWLTSDQRKEFKTMRDGEIKKAAEIVEEFKSLRRFIRRNGILWPLMLEAGLLSDSPASQQASLPQVSARSSPSLGGANEAHFSPPVKSETVVPYVSDNSQDSETSDFEIQDAPATSSPRPAKMS
ncbi:hypothetical protein RSOL_123650, partial [Rhizoctonia solani AG-3 Rhs1AP]